jgi:C4-dicarboxylate-binding protein DctP
MLIPAGAKFGPLGLSDFDVFDLPCLFPDIDGLHGVTQGPLGQSLLAKLDSRAIKGLAF